MPEHCAGRNARRALALDPDNAKVLLERGILRQRKGDADGVQANWQLAASLSPDSATAVLPEQDLALLDARWTR